MRWQGERRSNNVEDRRGMNGPKMAAGGGLAIVVALVMLFLGADPRQVQRILQNGPPGGAGVGQRAERPPTAAEVKQREFVETILAFTEDVWEEKFRESGQRYERPHMVLFGEEVSTRCGVAPSSVGPFYCPGDRTVYLDPSFFDELEEQLDGSNAEFSQAYVIAHEVGHHVQNLLGYSRLVDKKRAELPKAEFNRWSVRLELQADYLAGVWAHYGQKRFRFIEAGDVDAAIRSANAIGDDRLQRRSRGFVSPESFTHGTSAQRVKWFTLGLNTGDMRLVKEIFELPYEKL